MNKVLEDHPVGKLLRGAIEKTKKQYQGQARWIAIKKIEKIGIKKGDILYLDNLHKDHIEVFNGKTNTPRTVLNLDGSVNLKKLKKAIEFGRGI